MKNKYLEIQYKLQLQNLAVFAQSIHAAAKQDDGELSRDEAKQLRAIEKKCDSLKALLEKYLNETAQSD